VQNTLSTTAILIQVIMNENRSILTARSIECLIEIIAASTDVVFGVTHGIFIRARIAEGTAGAKVSLFN
jgi:hypothetical protein